MGNIRLEVIGEQHTTHRPAVFFINHQSTLIDAMVTSRVVQRGFTVVAKAEVKQIPVLGQLLTLADVAFVDRSNTSKAISAMQPAVEKLRAGISIVLAPEGTRSLSPRVGAFKKGGFHLARDAGVPIVPIVIRNAGEIMWRNAKVAQEGTIEVVVHEPVPTANWTRGDLDEWVSADAPVVRRYARQLAGRRGREEVVGRDRAGVRGGRGNDEMHAAAAAGSILRRSSRF